MKISITALRRIIKEELARLNEEAGDPAPPKAGSATAKGVTGSLDKVTIADRLGMDADDLGKALLAVRSGQRSSANDKILGDMVANLLDAATEDKKDVLRALIKLKPGEQNPQQ